MKKVFFALAFVFALHVNANNDIVNTNLQIEKTIVLEDDHCTITVNIYENGILVSSGTYTDHSGDCEVALAGAMLVAELNKK